MCSLDALIIIVTDVILLMIVIS